MTAPRPRPGVLDIDRYVGGAHSAETYTGEPAILASNETPLGPSPYAMEAFRSVSESLHRYPDGSAAELRAAIGTRFGVDPNRIVCGSGSDELIALLTRAYAGPGEEVLHTEYGFLMYRISAKSSGATPIAAPEDNLAADIDAILARAGDKTRVVFLANPNNPTGSYVSVSEIERLRAGLPDRALLVIDAAYAEYVHRNDYAAGIELVEAHDNVVMLRTFSKIFGLAALRLGWAYCPPDVVDVLNRVRSPFNVGAATQAAGVAAVADLSHTDAGVAHNDTWLPWLTAALEDLGLSPPPSIGNFALARFGDAETAASAYNFLMTRGVITRSLGGYGLPESLRITVGLEDELKRLVDALAELRKSP